MAQNLFNWLRPTWPNDLIGNVDLQKLTPKENKRWKQLINARLTNDKYAEGPVALCRAKDSKKCFETSQVRGHLNRPDIVPYALKVNSHQYGDQTILYDMCIGHLDCDIKVEDSGSIADASKSSNLHLGVFLGVP